MLRESRPCVGGPGAIPSPPQNVKSGRQDQTAQTSNNRLTGYERRSGPLRSQYCRAQQRCQRRPDRQEEDSLAKAGLTRQVRKCQRSSRPDDRGTQQSSGKESGEQAVHGFVRRVHPHPRTRDGRRKPDIVSAAGKKVCHQERGPTRQAQYGALPG